MQKITYAQIYQNLSIIKRDRFVKKKYSSSQKLLNYQCIKIFIQNLSWLSNLLLRFFPRFLPRHVYTRKKRESSNSLTIEFLFYVHPCQRIKQRLRSGNKQQEQSHHCRRVRETEPPDRIFIASESNTKTFWTEKEIRRGRRGCWLNV